MEFVPSLDGRVKIATRTWQGSGDEQILFAHATGFCKEMWEPIIEELRTKYNVLLPITTMDMRGHGDSVLDGPPFQLHWRDFGNDVLAVSKFMQKQYPKTKLIGVGHSKGAASLLMAETSNPGTFHGLVLVEPIVYPWYDRIPIESAENRGPMAKQAANRKATFSSLQEAKDYFIGKKMTKTWEPKFLESYVNGILKPIDEKDSSKGFKLKCHPLFEAEIYQTLQHNDTWDKIHKVKSNVSLIAGEDSNTYSEEHFKMFCEKFQRNPAYFESHRFPKLGHFLPFENSSLMTETIFKFLVKVGVVLKSRI